MTLPKVMDFLVFVAHAAGMQHAQTVSFDNTRRRIMHRIVIELTLSHEKFFHYRRQHHYPQPVGGRRQIFYAA